MNSTRAKSKPKAQFDINAPDSAERFQELALAFTAKVSKSKKTAMAQLQRAGIVTAKGNLSKRYSAK